MPTTDVTVVQVGWALIAAIVLFIPALALAAYLRMRRSGGIDLALLAAPLIWVATWAVALEVLSLVGLISRPGIRITAGVLLLMAFITLRWWWSGVRMLGTDLRRGVGGAVRVVNTPTWWRIPLWVAVAFTVVAVVMTLLVTIVGAPNNPDSLAYHLPRVMWWLQEGQLGSFVSSDPRQIAFPPLNSYLLLVSLAVPGGDLLTNFVQWSAAMLTALATLMIGWRAGLSRLAVFLVAILVLTIPSGITVATTTKADWLAAVWPVVALAAVVSRSRHRITTPWFIAIIGLSAALGGATKATSALAVAAVVALAVWWELRPPKSPVAAVEQFTARLGRGLLVALSAGIGVLAGLLPQALRTASVYGNATGPDIDIVVSEPSLAIAWANSIRTLLNNVGVPPPVSDFINPRLPDLLPLIGVPVADEVAIYPDATLQLLIGRNEDFATNPIHLVLGFLIGAIVIFIRRAPIRLRYVSAVAVVTFIGTVGILQWNLWTSRFLLGVIAILTVPLAWALAGALERSRERISVGSLAAIFVILVAAAYGAAISVFQEYRPVVGAGSILTTPRIDQYFTINDRAGTDGTMQQRVLEQVALVNALPDGARVGLAGLGAQEYLVWRFGNPDGRLVFVNLEGPEGRVTIDANELDEIVCIEGCDLLFDTG